MKKDAKTIARVLVERFRELDRQGELARMGALVGKAINDLNEKRRLTPRELREMRATI